MKVIVDTENLDIIPGGMYKQYIFNSFFKNIFPVFRYYLDFIYGLSQQHFALLFQPVFTRFEYVDHSRPKVHIVIDQIVKYQWEQWK